jgi:hypothetical protein
MNSQSKDTKVATADCRERFCTAARMDMDYVITDIANPETVLREAKEWLSLFYKEKKLSEEKYPSRVLPYLFPCRNEIEK